MKAKGQGLTKSDEYKQLVIKELEFVLSDPAHYKDSQNIVAVNIEYESLNSRVRELTVEWEDLNARAEQMTQEFHRARKEWG